MITKFAVLLERGIFVKKILSLILLIILSLSMMSCSNNISSEDEAKKVATNYIKILYNVEDFTKFKTRPIAAEESFKKEERLKPYITKEMVKILRMNRDIIFINWTSRNIQRNLSLEEIDLELNTNAEDKISFYYTAKIKLSSFKKEEEYRDIKGQIQLIKIDNEWKVKNDKPFNYLTTSIDFYKTKNISDVRKSTSNNTYSQLNSYVDAMFFTVNNTTNEKLTLKFPSSKLYQLILYKDGNKVWEYGDEISHSGENPVIKTLDKGESLVYCIDFPFASDSSKYEYEFFINAQGWENKEHLKGIVNLKK